MSLSYNNVQTCTVSETQRLCFTLPITSFTSSRLDVSSEPSLAQRPPIRALEQQREMTSSNNKVEKTLYICKKKKTSSSCRCSIQNVSGCHYIDHIYIYIYIYHVRIT